MRTSADARGNAVGGEWVRGLGAAAAERLRYGGLRTYVMRTTRYGTKTGQGKECGRARGRPATRSYMDATFDTFQAGKWANDTRDMRSLADARRGQVGEMK